MEPKNEDNPDQINEHVTVDENDNVLVDLNDMSAVIRADGEVSMNLHIDSESTESSMNLASAYVERGQEYYDAGRYQEAILEYQKATELVPDYNVLYFEMGKAELRAESFEGAIISFSRDLESSDPDPMSYWNRHIAYLNLGIVDEALNDLEQAITLSPEDADLYSQRGELRRQLGEIETALSDASKAVELEPLVPEFYHRLARLRILTQDVQSALTAWNSALDMDSEHIGALSGRAMVLLQTGRMSEALIDLDVVVALEPDSAAHHCNRGWAHEQLEEYNGAISDYQRAIEIQPDYTKALSNLESLQGRLGDPE